jgi:hypothetical protein
MNMNILQQDYQEKSQKIDEFQKIVDKSFYPVYGQDREGYLALQDKLLEETAKIYKNSGAKLSPRDYMKVNENVKGLESYVSNYVEAKQSMYDAVKGVTFDKSGKINREESLKALDEIAKLPLDQRLQAVQSGAWLSVKTTPPPVDMFDKMAKNFYDAAPVTVGDKDAGTQKYNVEQGGKVLNVENWKNALEANWQVRGQDYLNDGWFKNKEDYMAKGMAVSPKIAGKSTLIGKQKTGDGTDKELKVYPLTKEGDEILFDEFPVSGITKYWDAPNGQSKAVNDKDPSESLAGSKVVGARYVGDKKWAILTKPKEEQQTSSIGGSLGAIGGTVTAPGISKVVETRFYVPWDDVERYAKQNKIVVEYEPDEYAKFEVPLPVK